MNVIHRQHLPPSGIEFACQLSITPSTSKTYPTVITPSTRGRKPITNLVVARSTLLHVFELCALDSGPQASGSSGEAKVDRIEYKLFHVCEHRLHGKVTGLQKVATLDSAEDGLDRLLVSFEDAKMTLMEWSIAAADLVPISLHTFEKLPQITQGDLPRDYRAQLEADPLSRCAVLLLPQATLAVLPFFQDHLDLDGLTSSAAPNSALGTDQQRFQTFPYASSFILDLNQQLLNHQPSAADHPQRPIKSVLALKFLPGFSEPTLAVLYQCQYTWSARLENGTNTTALIVLTLDLGSNHFPIISHTQRLPYDAHGLVACPKELAGVLVLCADMILHVDQSSRIIGVATNGWVKHTSELQVPRQDSVQLVRLKDNNGRSGALESEPQMDLEDGEEEDNPVVPEGHEKLLVRLENSKIVFYRLDLALMFLRDGQVFSLGFEKDGRTLTKLALEKFDVRSVIPSTVVKLSDRCLFVGSMTGDSALYAVDDIHLKNASDHMLSLPTRSQISQTNMDLDIDDDIYGEQQDSNQVSPSGNNSHNFTLYRSNHQMLTDDPRSGAVDQQKIFLRLCDAIQAHGPIRDFTMAADGSEDKTLELLACTGAGDLGGLSVFHRDMPVRKRRKLNLNESTSEISRLHFTTLSRSGAVEKNDRRRLIWAVKPDHQTQIFSFSDSGEPTLVATLSGTTLAACQIFRDRFVVQVTDTHIKLFTSDLEEVQVIQPEPSVKIQHATIMDDYVMLETKCGLKLIYQGDLESKTLSKLPFPPSSHVIKTASFLKAALPTYSAKATNTSQPIAKDEPMHVDDEDDLYGTSSNSRQAPVGDVETSLTSHPAAPEAKANEEHSETNPTTSIESYWLLTTDEDGDFHILDLPTLTIVFTAKRIDSLPETLGEEEEMENGADPADFFGSVDQPNVAEPIVQIFGFLTGTALPRPHLAVMLKTGAFAVYELVTSYANPQTFKGKQGYPAVLLKKVIGRQFEALEEPDEPSANDNPDPDPKSSTEHRTKLRTRSFTALGMTGHFRGAFLSGEAPVWLVSTDHGPCRIYESSEQRSVDAVAQLPDGFLMCLSHAHEGESQGTVQGSEPSQQELWETFVSEFVCLDREIPTNLVKTGRSFNKVVYDAYSGTVVGASYLETAFANFDEEGNAMWEPDDDSLVRPTTFRSSLELILPGNWITIDGHEFQQNEWVTSLASIDLDSRSMVSGRRQFIGVGTTCNRAEDLAARGAIYVFEVVYVNPHERHPRFNRGLRLRYHEETKACVTAVDAINGYFLHTMGQKLYAKCFEQDERLLAVGFLDIKPYTSCLRIFKNFMLLGDAAKGITLVAFQEDPYRLIELGHTYVDLKCSTVDFLVIDSKLAIVATDLDGTIRVFEYNPTNIESQVGQKLLCRTEYHTSGEVAASMQVGKRLTAKDEAKVMGALFVSFDGSISSLVPTKDAVYKRLQLVQTRLTRHIQHFAGLNPRGYRTVRNDMVSRAINRGILDGELLNKFELLSVNQQREIATLAGSDRETVLVNLLNLRSLW